jgi:hypothetical protein
VVCPILPSGQSNAAWHLPTINKAFAGRPIDWMDVESIIAGPPR